MKIFTYWDAVPGIGIYDERMLIAIWEERCRAVGFAPIVLNEWWARQHPYFPEFTTKIEALPSINPLGYDRACFIRWLAVARAIEVLCKDEGGGIMSDYDVMPYVKPFNDINHLINTERLTLFQKHVPCFVAGLSDHFVYQCLRFAEYRPEPDDTDDKGTTHISDMTILAKHLAREPETYAPLDVCKMYTDEGWGTAPLVHYANQVMVPNGKAPRWKHIPQLR